MRRGDVTSPADMLPDTLFEKQTPLQDLDGGYAASRGRRAPIPFNLVLIIGGTLIVLAVAIIVIVILATGGEDPATTTTTAAMPAPIAIAPAPAAPTQSGFSDRFEDRDRLGRQYEVKTGHADHVRIENAMLTLASPDDSPVRVDLTPRRSDELFREASLTANIKPGVQFRFGIAATAILTVEHLASGNHNVRVSIGTVVDASGTSSSLTLSNLDTLRIRLEREAGTIYWFINDQPVATSPEIPPRGTPMIEMSATGPAGNRCTIDEIRVTYDSAQ